METEILEDIVDPEDTFYTALVWTDEGINVHYVDVSECEDDVEASDFVCEQVKIWYPHLDQNDDPRWQVWPGELQVTTHISSTL